MPDEEGTVASDEGGKSEGETQAAPASRPAAPAPDFEDEGPVRYRMPDHKNREMFAIADQLLGASKMIAMCEDGKSRMARIPGKMKRRMWIKPGDLIIIRPWDIQDDKADVKYRYLRTQSSNMSRRGLIPELLDVGF